MDPFIVSARKYRPATFDTVVGQQPITSTLKNAIKNKQLAQAFLFTGPRGVGKTTCARILAKTINCENISENIEACNECESCKSFNQSHSFNVHELDAASNNSVEGIRSLVDQVRIPPQVGKYKVYIIDEVHMLSQAAFNAFLKTLEEPPGYAKFILATTERHKIIPTILSRCQIFDFARIRVEDITRQLQYVAEKEGITAEPNALHIIGQKADGAMRDALSIFDQLVSLSGNSISYKQVIENLNVLDYDYYFKMTELLLQGKTSEVLLLINEIILKGFEGSDFITGFGGHLRNLLVGRDPATVKLIEVSDSIRDAYIAQSKQCPENFLLEALEINARADVQYKSSSNKRLMLELALLQIAGLLKKKPRPEPSLSTPSLPEPEKPGEPRKPAPQGQETTPRPASPPDSSEPSTPAPTKLPSGISLKITQQETDEDDMEDHLQEDGDDLPNEHFSLQHFLNAWNTLAEQMKEESQGLFLAMTKYEPKINKEGVVRVTIDNMVQNDLIQERKAELLSHLRKELNNYSIQIETGLMENQQQQKAYLPKEKFEKLMEKNPEVGRLKKELDLDYDY